MAVLSSPEHSGAVTTANGTAIATPGPVLEGTCRFAGCKVQHLHKVTGVPPDYHWKANDGTPLPRWEEPSYRRRGHDPSLWYYRIGEIAEITGCCWNTIRRWIGDGHLPCFRAPGKGRVMLVLGKDLDTFLRSTNRVYGQEKKK